MRNRNCIEYFPSVFSYFHSVLHFSHVNLPFWNTIHKIFFRTIILNLNGVGRPIIFLFRWYQGFYTVHARLNRFIQFSAFGWTTSYFGRYDMNHIIRSILYGPYIIYDIRSISFWSKSYSPCDFHLIIWSILFCPYQFGLCYFGPYIMACMILIHIIWFLTFWSILFRPISSTLTAVVFLHYMVSTKMALEILDYTICRVWLWWLVSLPLEVSK